MPPDGRLVWLASYPKSGNTWLRILIANYLSDAGRPIDINQINLNSPYPITKTFLEEEGLLDPHLFNIDEANHLRSCIMEDFVQRCDTVSYVKIHDKFQAGRDGSPLFGRGNRWSAVYILRDPRDVVVSTAHHNNISIDKALTVLNNPHHVIGGLQSRRRNHVPQRVGDWSGHAASWIDQSDLAVHILRYEDLLADPVGAFSAVLAFMGHDIRAEQVERAVRFSDFTELQRQERQSNFYERPPRAIAPFFRSGRAGAWAEVLTTAQSAAITAAHRPMMQRFGYV